MALFLNLPVTTTADIAAAVWQKLTADTLPAGSFGARVRDNLDATVNSRASASAVAAVQSDADALQLDTASLLARLTAARALLLEQLDPAMPNRVARQSDVTVTAPDTYGGRVG